MIDSIRHTAKMNNGYSMPIFGLGTYKITDIRKARLAFEHAIDLGYRHFDTAALYDNEEILGDTIRNSGISREEFFITSKLWNDDQGYNSSIEAFNRSNDKIGLGYIDLYLIHWPVKKYRLESWKALEKVYLDKRVKAIGVSNYMFNHLSELIDNCTIKPAVNQIELSPFNYKSRSEIIQLCVEHDILVTAYCPLTRGTKLGDSRLVMLAEKYQKTPAQILIRWGLEHGICEIPKSGNLNRIEENAEVFDFSLTENDVEIIDSWDEGLAVSWDPTKAD